MRARTPAWRASSPTSRTRRSGPRDPFLGAAQHERSDAVCCRPGTPVSLGRQTGVPHLRCAAKGGLRPPQNADAARRLWRCTARGTREVPMTEFGIAERLRLPRSRRKRMLAAARVAAVLGLVVAAVATPGFLTAT